MEAEWVKIKGCRGFEAFLEEEEEEEEEEEADEEEEPKFTIQLVYICLKLFLILKNATQ